ncbi:MAG: anthranilate synthase component I family protein [Planctomycetaceae bacterium]|nr:anthranilate synthase component I family protein [Planctomycetaceae bacterium]
MEFSASEFVRIFCGDSNPISVNEILHAYVARFPAQLGQLFLESVVVADRGRHCDASWSYWLPAPNHWTMTREANLSDWQSLEAAVRNFTIEPLPADFPPFVGGAAGMLAYDWCRALEQIPPPARDDFQVPNLAMGIYDHLVAVDHDLQRVYLIANGFPHTDLVARERASLARLAELVGRLGDMKIAVETSPRRGKRMSSHLELAQYFPLAFEESSKGDLPPEIWTATEPARYLESIERALAYLRAGDIFQVNLAQQLLVPLRDEPLEFYRRMRQSNTAPFAAYFDLGNHQLVSASPERLVRVRGRAVQTRPIKGTRRLTGQTALDEAQAVSLQESTKDCSENVMIVDLLRNDLSRVCSIDSLRVTQLCGLEPYRHVQHLVSVVEGELAADQTPWDLIPAIFPGGSITGAPKVRAMNIINELEPVARGAYCGSLGYIGFSDTNGMANADWNILIRTATLCGDWCQIPVGGGIVLDSEPTAEYKETLDKARGLLMAASHSLRAWP